MSIRSLLRRARTTCAALGSLIAMAAAPAAHADTVGLHVASWHDRAGYNNVTPGLMYRSNSGLTVGAYCNSESRSARFQAAPRCRVSGYAGQTWDWEITPGLTVGITAGVLTGYQRNPVLPFVVPSIRIGEHLRVLYAPARDPKPATAVSLVIEMEI